MSKNITVSATFPMDQIKRSACGQYWNLPLACDFKVEGLPGASAYCYKGKLVIKAQQQQKQQQQQQKQQQQPQQQDDRIANLEASMGRLAEMMAAMMPKVKTKAK